MNPWCDSVCTYHNIKLHLAEVQKSLLFSFLMNTELKTESVNSWKRSRCVLLWHMSWFDLCNVLMCGHPNHTSIKNKYWIQMKPWLEIVFFFSKWNMILKINGLGWKLLWLCPLAEAECGSHAVLLHYSVGLEGSCLQLITSMRNSHITAW